MSDHRPRPIDRDTAEHLLQGVPVEQDGTLDPLAALLAAAAAPARPAEFAGEQAALAAFRQAQLARPVAPAGRSRLARFLSIKMAALTLAATGLGGVAVAAGSGALPAPVERKAPAVAPSLSRTAEPLTPRTQDAPPPPSQPTAPSRSPVPSASPSASLPGLCRAWLASSEEERRKSLRKPAFAPVVKAAGGKKRVARYCNGLVGGGRQRGGDNTEQTPKPKPTGNPDDSEGRSVSVNQSSIQPDVVLTG
jgi:hypothetical protein